MEKSQHEKAILAIRARIMGEWDNPYLENIFLTNNTVEDIIYIIAHIEEI